ncbi:MAG: 4-(cytidine 5'-diphospho)-2-C-methyl-D-erythritol kinase [Ilumatobacteraceae bacterium]
MDEHTTSLTARAKLTISLRITGVRNDGFHYIDAEMVTLDLADLLTVSRAGTGLDVVGPFATGVSLDENNLVNRALRICDIRAHVRIDKRIPVGGGLGGGSADAAAILRWANFTDLVVASELGADIPFCMVGGRAQVQGIGEIILPMPFVATDITLVIPPLTISTPKVYMAWDELGVSKATGSNDLERAALVVEPRLANWRDKISAATGLTPTLAGSGSTWWIYGAHHRLADELPGAMVLVTKTSPAFDQDED